MMTGLRRTPTASALLTRLIDAPDLVRTVRGLPEAAFSALVRHIGVEDAGELVALATTDQLVAAFDEDLFVNMKPGERETFDSARFIVWIEVLLEAGDEVAASRIAALSEDFVVRVLSEIVLVLDHDALLARMSEGGEDALHADKAIERSLSEELDGYLLVSRKPDGWDAALALILALDRDDRFFLERILDRCADLASSYVDDLDQLATVLSAEDSLAEDIEAEREERRSRRGYVEPRTARSFLSLARQPLTTACASGERDPITRAYFRNLERPAVPKIDAVSASPQFSGLLDGLEGVSRPLPPALASPVGVTSRSSECIPLIEAMRILKDAEPQAFAERMEEFVYLANVLLAGAEMENRRLRPAEAAEAVLLTVALGADLEARDRAADAHQLIRRASMTELGRLLRTCRADLLFRKASSTLVAQQIVPVSIGFLRSREELDKALEQLGLVDVTS